MGFCLINHPEQFFIFFSILALLNVMPENRFHLFKGSLFRGASFTGYMPQILHSSWKSLLSRLEYPHDPLTFIFFHARSQQIKNPQIELCFGKSLFRCFSEPSGRLLQILVRTLSFFVQNAQIVLSC